MNIEIRYIYTQSEQAESIISAYLYAESPFAIGGFTLKPSFKYDNSIDNPVNIKSISGNNDFFLDSYLETQRITGIYLADDKGINSSLRPNENGHWLLLGNYTINEDPDYNINISTSVREGDFFDANGSDLDINSSTQLLLTRTGNSTGDLSISGALVEGSNLSITSTIDDPDGISGNIAFSWQRSADGSSGWTTIPDANADAYTLTQADVGFHIRAVASYTDSLGTAEVVKSNITSTAVENINDEPTGSLSIDGQFSQYQTLTAISSIADPDGIPGPINFSWQRFNLNNGNWDPITGATSSSYTLSQDDVGAYIRVVASYTDGYGFAESVATPAPEEAVGNINDLPTGSIHLSGSLTQYQTLSADASTVSDLDGLGHFSYTWLRSADGSSNWRTIKNATASTYTLSQDDVGSFVKARISYTDAYDTNESVESDATSDAIENVNDQPSGNLTLSGTATQNATLTAISSITDLDGLGVLKYSWQRSANGTADWATIDSANSSAYTLTQNDVGFHIRAIASYTDQAGSKESVASDATTTAVTNTNDPPGGSLSIKGKLSQHQSLSLINTITDPDGLNPFSYQWQRSKNGISDWATIALANSSAYTLTQDDVGFHIRAIASYIDQGGTEESIASAPSLTAIADVSDPPTGSISLSGIATQGNTLSLTNTIDDPDGIDGNIAFSWQRSTDGSSGWSTIQDANADAYTLTQADVDFHIRAVASYTDSLGTAEVIESNITSKAVENINDEPTGSLSIEGHFSQNQTLNAISSIADPDGIPGPINFSWQRFNVGTTNWDPITGATSSSYTLSQDDVGAYIRVVASYTDGYGFAESVATPAPEEAVGNINDLPTGSIHLSGSLTQYQTLSADASTVSDLDGLGHFSYTWLRSADGSSNWRTIKNATASTYTLSQDDVGSFVKARISYTDAYDTNESVESDATSDAIENVNDQPSGNLTLSGTATQNATLTAISSITDLDGLGVLKYSWQRSANGTADWATIDSANSSAYTLTQNDVGFHIRAIASYTDQAGSKESVASDATTTAVTNTNDPPGGSLSISGKLSQHQSLSLINTITDPDGLNPFGYQWQRSMNGISDWATIHLANSSSYTLTQDDVGFHLRAIASYTDQGGSEESVASAATKTAIANVNDLPTGQLLITDASIKTETIHSINTIEDIDGITEFKYQWQRLANGDERWQTIEHANQEHYLLKQEDIDHQIRCVVTYLDKGGQQETIISSPTPHHIKAIHQTISVEKESFFHRAGETAEIPLHYTSNDPTGMLQADFRIHYNNSGLSIEIKETASEEDGINRIITSGPQADTQDLDNNPATTHFIEVKADPSGENTGKSMNIKNLLTLSFSALDGDNDPLLGQDAYKATITSARDSHYSIFQSTSFSVEEQNFSIDINNDSDVSLYTDGIMIIRKLIGLKDCTTGFAEDFFNQKNGRSAEEVNKFLDRALLDGSLDFDQNGKTSLYTDGILLIRHLISPSLIEQSDDLIGDGSPFAGNLPLLNEYLESLK